jgi:DNA-binding NarL/FixJ family response regulator
MFGLDLIIGGKMEDIHKEATVDLIISGNLFKELTCKQVIQKARAAADFFGYAVEIWLQAWDRQFKVANPASPEMIVQSFFLILEMESRTLQEGKPRKVTQAASQETRDEIVAMRARGMMIKDIAKETGLSASSINLYIKLAKDQAKTAALSEPSEPLPEKKEEKRGKFWT